MSTHLNNELNALGEGSNRPGFRPMTAIERQQQDDLSWAATATEVQQHYGKLVVIHKQRVIAVGTDRKTLLEQASALEQCPWWELVVEVVPPLGLWEPPR
jgi:hypothetical protein